MVVEPPHDFPLQGHGVAPQDLFIDSRTSCLKKHRYRHQDYLSSMFLTKDTKNYEHFLLGPFHFRAAKGHACYLKNQINEYAKYVGGMYYVGSDILIRFVKKSRKKEKNYRVLQQTSWV